MREAIRVPERAARFPTAMPSDFVRFLTITAFALGLLLSMPSRPAQAGGPGINRAFMDTSVEPCANFFRYANGAWYDTASIPAAYTGVGAGREMFDRNQEALHQVLEDALTKSA